MKIGEIAASNVNRTSMVTNSELEKDCKPVDNGEINKSEVDADVKLATASTKKKDSYGINVTDAKNFEQDVKNTKGTVYVVMGNLPGCYYCKKLAQEMQGRLGELEEVSDVYNIQWNDNSKLCREIYQQGASKGSSATFPQIAKFVDGEFVELVDNPRNPKEAVDTMIKTSSGKGDNSAAVEDDVLDLPQETTAEKTEKTDETKKTEENKSNDAETKSKNWKTAILNYLLQMIEQINEDNSKRRKYINRQFL